MKRVVVLTGAGVSAESGLSTFRDAGGLWEGYDIQDVASPAGWAKNPRLVLEFYNQRRRDLSKVEPNEAHKALVELEKSFKVDIITQNVDDLHERAGSKRVLHLHGELLKARSSHNPKHIVDWTTDLNLGDTDEKGHQMRPHIVWFGEQVNMMDKAIQITIQADIFIIVGTSLVVYPAASLIDYVGYHKPKYIVDPNTPAIKNVPNLYIDEIEASIGVPKLVKQLLQNEAEQTWQRA